MDRGEEKTLYKEIFETLTDGLIVLDQTHKIKELNQSAEHILNLSRKKLLGKRIEEILPDEIIEIVNKAESEERAVSDDELEVKILFNQPVSLQITVIPHLNSLGEIDGFIIQIRDIEGVKFLSNQNTLHSFNSNFENLILGLTHELKNPLSSIKGAAQLLGEDISKEELKKCSEIFVNEVNRLLNLIERIKRLENFNTENMTEVDINEILLDIIFLQSRLVKGKIKFTHELDVSIPQVHGNEDSLKQVFINIINNAIESISNNGEITIQTKLVNEYKLGSSSLIFTSIKDNGKGISKKQLQKIFTPFFTTKGKGSGLGLFISHQIIAKHGGTIFVESEEGKGTMVKIYLPTKTQT